MKTVKLPDENGYLLLERRGIASQPDTDEKRQGSGKSCTAWGAATGSTELNDAIGREDACVKQGSAANASIEGSESVM